MSCVPARAPESQAAAPLVLHVEDDAELAAGVTQLLRTYGIATITAGDGAAALERLACRDVCPDVLIMDVDLPGELDGADAAQEICHALGHVVPTIFLSGRLSDVGLPWLPGAPLLFVAKPIDPEVLVKVVASFADLGRFLRTHSHR